MTSEYNKIEKSIRKKEGRRALAADYGNSRRFAIHLFCISCMGGSATCAAKCENQECFLWPYRTDSAKAKTKRDEGLIPTKLDYENKMSKNKTTSTSTEDTDWLDEAMNL